MKFWGMLILLVIALLTFTSSFVMATALCWEPLISEIYAHWYYKLGAGILMIILVIIAWRFLDVYRLVPLMLSVYALFCCGWILLGQAWVEKYLEYIVKMSYPTFYFSLTPEWKCGICVEPLWIILMLISIGVHYLLYQEDKKGMPISIPH